VRLRQKLFAAILGIMAVMFMLLALVSFLHGLEAQTGRHELLARLRRGASAAFVDAARGPGEVRWDRFAELMGSLGFTDWCVLREGGGVVAGPSSADAAGLEPLAWAGGYKLLVARSPRELGLEPIRWLSGLFWAVTASTALLLLVVYGLLLRLVLRPVEDLVEASRKLGSGARPPKVPGGHRTDEIGELVGAFNLMAAEVASSREELERRVEEATRERERALKRLALEQRLSATGTFAAGVAHEIANPLGGMINAVRTLSDEQGLSQRGREYLALVQEGLERIAALVERMRSFVRPRPSVGPVDLASVVRGAVEFVRHRIEKEGVRLVEGPFEPAVVSGDAGELQQVLLNLIVNALDAMRDTGEKRLALRTRRDGARALAEVADTGRGMTAEELSSAFDLFYTTKQSGTGLGLAIAHKIVTDHGGEIELESSPGAGTTARVSLPVSE